MRNAPEDLSRLDPFDEDSILRMVGETPRAAGGTRRSRPHFGSLVLTMREKRTGAMWAISAPASRIQCLNHTRRWPLRTGTSPFRQKVKDQAATTWVKPKLVADVKFTEWTEAGEIRHPAFLGLREDKNPTDVVMEKARRVRAT